MRRRNLMLVFLFTTFLGCDLGSSGTSGSGRVVMLPQPGLPRYQQLGAIAVPGGLVSPAGGNFLHRRVDFTIDTRLGTRSVGAVYNTADDAWRWSWELEFTQGGNRLVDETGAVHELIFGVFEPNRIFPGGKWVRIDATRMRSLGGLVHEFHPTGKLAAIHWQSADYPRLVYRTALPDGAGGHVAVDQCTAPADCTLVYAIERDAWGRVTALEDRSGRRAEFAYDAEGRLATARDPLDLERGWPGRRYAWWGTRLSAITNSEGERTEYESAWTTGQLLVARQLGTPNRVQRFTWYPTAGARPLDEPSRQVDVRDAEGHVSSVFVDGRRRVRRVRRPSGAETAYEYTASSFELASVTQPDGTRTRWEFDGETRITRTDPSGNVVRIDVRLDAAEERSDPFQRPIERIFDDLGTLEERGYDAQGRLAWVENGEGERTTFAWDAGNQLASVTPPHGVVRAFSGYGEHGHAGTLEEAGEVETRVHDGVGNLLSASGRDLLDLRPGGEIARSYDADRNPSAVWREGGAILLEHRSDGRPLAIRRPGGGDHEFVYDAGGLLVARLERVDGAWQTTSFEVDRLGRVTLATLPNGMQRGQAFTPDGELARLWSGRTGVAEPESEALLGWQAGRLVSVSDLAHAADESIAYDAAGRPSTITYPDGESAELDYDLRGRLVQETLRLPGGSVLRSFHTLWDDADRLLERRDGANLLVAQSWLAGRLDTRSTGNGLVEAYAYSGVTGLLSGSTLSGASGLVALLSISESVTAQGIEVSSGTSSPLAVTQELELLVPSAGGGAAGKRLGSGATFDALGNLLAYQGQGFAFNAEGNRRAGAASDAAGYASAHAGVPLAWRADGRIAAIGEDVFEWDALGRPLSRSVGGEERRFAFGGAVETDAADTPLRIDLGVAVLELDTGATRYRHADHRGNVALVTDDAGEVVAHYAYDAYGQANLIGSDDGARSFAGGRLVQGLVLLGMRVLDPAAGRFLAPDPILQLANQFAYTSGNPLRFQDASGAQESAAVRYAEGQAALEVGLVTGFVGAIAIGVATFNAPVLVTLAVVGGTLGLTVPLVAESIRHFRAAEVLEREERRRNGSGIGNGLGASGSTGAPGGIGGAGTPTFRLPALPPPPVQDASPNACCFWPDRSGGAAGGLNGSGLDGGGGIGGLGGGFGGGF